MSSSGTRRYERDEERECGAWNYNGEPHPFHREWKCRWSGTVQVAADREDWTARWTCPDCGTDHIEDLDNDPEGDAADRAYDNQKEQTWD